MKAWEDTVLRVAKRVRQLDTTEKRQHIPPSAKFEDFKFLEVTDSIQDNIY